MTHVTSILMLLLSASLIMVGCQKTTVEGPGGKEMALVAPRSFDIARGQTRTLQVRVDRKNFTDPVKVSLSQLPSGVSATDASQTIETNMATFVVTADGDASLVKGQKVMVSVEGPDGMSVKDYVDMNVTTH